MRVAGGSQVSFGGGELSGVCRIPDSGHESPCHLGSPCVEAFAGPLDAGVRCQFLPALVLETVVVSGGEAVCYLARDPAV